MQRGSIELKAKMRFPDSHISPSMAAPMPERPESHFVEHTGSVIKPSEPEHAELIQLHYVLESGLLKMEQRVDRSFQAIMSSMSILESEKAIAQGVAITRLTELAFFFIPLSFAATFFSMQIKVTSHCCYVLLRTNS
jgi:hypothetical protein